MSLNVRAALITALIAGCFVVFVKAVAEWPEALLVLTFCAASTILLCMVFQLIKRSLRP